MKLPKGWASSSLDCVAEWGSGGTPDRSRPDFFGGGIPWIKTGELKDKVIYRTEETLSQDGLAQSSARIFPRGSVGIAMYGATIGKLSIWGIDAATNQACAVARPHLDVLSNLYLYYFLESEKRDLVAAGKGGAQPNISQRLIRDWPIALPPLAEQHRIVAKIEELFSELDAGVESLTRARTLLETYREAAIQNILDGVPTDKSIVTTFGSLIGGISQGWSPKCDGNLPVAEGDWAIIKTTVVQPMLYDGMECKLLPKNLAPRPSIEVKVGDFLMTRKGPRTRTGVVCLVRKTRARSMLCDTVYRFRCDESKVSADFFELLLNSPRVTAEIDKRKSGISDSGISLNHTKLRSLPLKVPSSLAVQQTLIVRIARVLEEVQRMDNEIDSALAKIVALRQSILKKAFSGQLVPQDPADEPASVLLARLREKAPTTKTPRKKTA